MSSSLSAIDLSAAEADGGEDEVEGRDSSGGRVTAIGVERGGSGGGMGRGGCGEEDSTGPGAGAAGFGATPSLSRSLDESEWLCPCDSVWF